MLIIPGIDLHGGLCVRLKQGRRHEAKVYDGDAVEIAVSYQLDGARMLHIVDLDGAFADPNSLNRRVLSKIVSTIGKPWLLSMIGVTFIVAMKTGTKSRRLRNGRVRSGSAHASRGGIWFKILLK